MFNELYDADFDTKLIEIKDKSVVFYVGASWCGPCRALGPVIKTLSDEFPDVEFLKIDIDGNPSISEYFSIQAVPTLIFMKNGEIKERVVGLKSKASLAEILNTLLMS